MTAGNWPWWFTASVVVEGAYRLNADSGTWRAGRRADVDVPQRLGALPEARLDLHDDVVLVQRRVDDRHLPLAERVVERVVDQLRRDAEPRGRAPVDGERGLEPLVLQVAAHVDELRRRPEPLLEPAGPGTELLHPLALERVLVLGVAEPRADVDVLDRLEERRRARHLGEPAPEPRHDLLGAELPAPARLQRDEQPRGVPRGAAAVPRP